MLSSKIPFSSHLKSILSVSVLLTLIVGFLCVSFIHALSIHPGTGSDLIIHTAHEASVKNCCAAEVSNHMELWKTTLVGIPQNFQGLLVLIVLAVASSFAFSSFQKIPRLNSNIIFCRYRQYARAHPEILNYNPLRLAFARGILHPKTF